MDSSQLAWFSSPPTMFPDVENKKDDYSGELDLAVTTDEELDSFLRQDIDVAEIPSLFRPIYDADHEPPAKIPKPSNFSEFSSSTTPIILSFGAKKNAPENRLPSAAAAMDLDVGGKSTQNVKKSGRVRPPSQTYDHIIAERKRREQLGQCLPFAFQHRSGPQEAGQKFSPRRRH